MGKIVDFSYEAGKIALAFVLGYYLGNHSYIDPQTRKIHYSKQSLSQLNEMCYSQLEKLAMMKTFRKDQVDKLQKDYNSLLKNCGEVTTKYRTLLKSKP